MQKILKSNLPFTILEHEYTFGELLSMVFISATLLFALWCFFVTLNLVLGVK